ncbi:MAG: arylesterase [Kiloniellales bacterium]|nr:arylesterase [Kiloniellales bacterium]
MVIPAASVESPRSRPPAGFRGPVFLLAVLLFLGGLLIQASSTSAQPLKLLTFGDSLIHGYGLPAGETFPAQLEAALRAEGFDIKVLNGGNSGDTTAAGRARLDWALSDDPDLVLVTLGGNDMLRGLEPSETYRNLDAILTRLETEGLPVLLTGMLAPRNLGAEYAAEFDAVFPRLAEEHDVAFYPFFLDGVAMRPEFNQPDGLHPNGAGVAVIVEAILPALRPLIDAAQARGSDG